MVIRCTIQWNLSTEDTSEQVLVLGMERVLNEDLLPHNHRLDNSTRLHHHYISLNHNTSVLKKPIGLWESW